MTDNTFCSDQAISTFQFFNSAQLNIHNSSFKIASKPLQLRCDKGYLRLIKHNKAFLGPPPPFYPTWKAQTIGLYKLADLFHVKKVPVLYEKKRRESAEIFDRSVRARDASLRGTKKSERRSQESF
ncbi:MAG TPA: hypothetical protein VNU95_07595 [Candidatus Acidoferrales bacterium]|nr:hypothetical protein [Candidatus Acidoferrales bacterium]